MVCRSKEVARERFGILEDEEGVCYTRTGRGFFEDLVLKRELLATVQGCSGGELVLGSIQAHDHDRQLRRSRRRPVDDHSVCKDAPAFSGNSFIL
jgi:hypothetical protein